MKDYPSSQKKAEKQEFGGQKQQEKSLREFKSVLRDLLQLMRKASGIQTAYMCWINRSRGQFVMETHSTTFDNVMFEDRTEFSRHFLEAFKDISQPTQLKIGSDIAPSELNHYYQNVPVKYITLIPFTNNDETVAITVLESEQQINHKTADEQVFKAYNNALQNILNTYLEVSDLQNSQQQWVDYEDVLAELEFRGHHAAMIPRLVNMVQSFLPEGAASFLAQGKDEWNNVMNAGGASLKLPLGMSGQERSVAYQSLKEGKPVFNIHFNNNPKRLSPREGATTGATLAVPLMMNDYRQGVLLAYHKNPMVFKESVKHKIINLVRIAGLKMMAGNPSLEVKKPIFSTSFGAYLPDMWEQTVDAVLDEQSGNQPQRHSWFGLVRPSNLAELRTKLRLEQLQELQSVFVSTLNPNNYGISGMLGYHADYIYSFLIQAKNERAINKWTDAVRDRFSKPLSLSDDVSVQTSMEIGFLALTEAHKDSYQVLNHAKSALAEVMESGTNEIV